MRILPTNLKLVTLAVHNADLSIAAKAPTKAKVKLKVGDKVKALWEGELYPATVKAVKNNGKVTVEWKDGSGSATVKVGDIKALKSIKPTASKESSKKPNAEEVLKGLKAWVEDYKAMRKAGNVNDAVKLRDKIRKEMDKYNLDEKRVWGEDPDNPAMQPKVPKVEAYKANIKDKKLPFDPKWEVAVHITKGAISTWHVTARSMTLVTIDQIENDKYIVWLRGYWVPISGKSNLETFVNGAVAGSLVHR